MAQTVSLRQTQHPMLLFIPPYPLVDLVLIVLRFVYNQNKTQVHMPVPTPPSGALDALTESTSLTTVTRSQP